MFSQPHCARRTIAGVLGTITLFFSLVAASFAAPLPDSLVPFQKEVILYIGHFNWDCNEDTLVGVVGDNLQYLPTGIRWGGYDTVHTPPCPPPPGGGGPDYHPHHPRYPFTEIEYPAWGSLRGAVAIDSLNEDSLMDLLLFFSGTVGDSAHMRDSSRILAIFGQNGLDTVANIRIDTIGTFQSAPFFAMDFQKGIEFTEPALRDYSRDTSWVLNRVSEPVPSSRQQPQVPADVAHPWQVKVFPNPAGSSTQVEGRLIPPGNYVVEVISVNGRTESKQEVTVSETGELFRVLDLKGLASGYYLVRLHAHDKLFGTYPIIITR